MDALRDPRARDALRRPVCHKVIAVEWLISAEERSEQAANGVSYKALVEGNNVLTKELRELTDA